MNMLQLFVELLSIADAIKVNNGNVLTDWVAKDITGNPENIVLSCTWTADNVTQECTLSEAQVAEASFDVNRLCFELCQHGESTTVAMYALMPLVPTA